MLGLFRERLWGLGKESRKKAEYGASRELGPPGIFAARKRLRMWQCKENGRSAFAGAPLSAEAFGFGDARLFDDNASCIGSMMRLSGEGSNVHVLNLFEPRRDPCE